MFVVVVFLQQSLSHRQKMKFRRSFTALFRGSGLVSMSSLSLPRADASFKSGRTPRSRPFPPGNELGRRPPAYINNAKSHIVPGEYQ